MNRIVSIGFFSLLICLASGCFEEDYVPEPTTNLTIFEQLLSNEEYSQLAKALSKAGLDNRLAVDGPFTFFAPNNTTLTAFLDAESTNIEDVSASYLKEILSYHLFGGLMLPEDFEDSGYLTSLSRTDNSLKGISLYYQQNGNQLALNNQVNIDLVGEELANGILYPINEILTLPRLTDFLNIPNNGLSRMIEGFDLASYTNSLEVSGQRVVFTPTNEAFDVLFDSLSINSLNELDGTNFPTPAVDVVNYHILPDSNFLINDLFSDTFLIKMKNEQNIKIQFDTSFNDFVIIDNSSNVISFEERDIQASNGIMHILNHLMIP